MRHLDVSEAPTELTTLAREVVRDDQPISIGDGDTGLAWLVSHHEYARLIALAHRGAQTVASGGEEHAGSRRLNADEVEHMKEADRSLQQAWADRQALWTIKA